MKKLFYLFLFVFAANSIAGPMGLRKGMSLAELNRAGTFTSKEPNYYSSERLVSGHEDFDGYGVILTPATGVCKFIASGKTKNVSSFGTELSTPFKALVAALTQKYGAPTSQHDFVRDGSIWNEPRDWMMGLLKNERVLVAFWMDSKTLSLPDDLQSISISASAFSSEKGWITISYEFNNFSECKKSLDAKKNSNL